ncbi:hypothetical protein GON03_18665 [Nocardioides sp. MAH-18]|uniref:Uncharacterized protein n=1 Tax=Nocardioides agri TaxID=2682843 RepID=A0A6L6XVI1_9ACTN|nr:MULTISPECIES: hypothetical protein [unclassified Nocardioides]MBA2956367.1 hypothetical protein [Nocardioides sp. CGMCC 1.13656]MVQ51210.1 hypothetical protein [Nocardioides sp. MAH-18]
MAWDDDLFEVLDDLEQQAEAAYDAERGAEVADRSRSAYQEVTLASRLMASVGELVGMDVRGVGAVAGTLERVGTGWCLLAGPAGEWVLPFAAVTAVRGASARSLPEAAWSPVARLGLGAALRRVADGGAECVVHLDDGRRVEGTVQRVGADFVEVRTLAGEPVLVPYAALAAVQSRP